MTGRIILCVLVGALLAGCVSRQNVQRKGPRIPLHEQRKQAVARGDHGLKYFPGVGWKYIPPGMDSKVLKMEPDVLMDHAQKTFKENDLDESMFAARLYLANEAGGARRAEAQMLIAQIYEKRGLEQYAFEEYQKLVDEHPQYEKNELALKRMYEIASQYLDGKWFRWKLPYQDTVFIPIGPSMSRTTQLFTQIVTNAPYGTYAAQSQYGIGQAHEKRLSGFWGFFASESEYEKAADAYQLLADRYSTRPGDAPRPNQDILDDIVATARFRMAKLYEIQANEGIYDQSMANRAIDAYKDFRYLHGKDPHQAKRMDEAAARIKSMRMERARGLKSIAEYYEERYKWVAAQKYYGRLVDALRAENVGGGDNLLNDPAHQAQAEKWQQLAAHKISSELLIKRIHQALDYYQRAKESEADGEFSRAKRHYRVTILNLQSLPELSIQNLVTANSITPTTRDQALKVKAAMAKDLIRIEIAINNRAINQ